MEPKRLQELFDFALVEQALLMHLHPSPLLLLIIGMQLASQLPEMLAGVIQIDDLNGARKMLLRQVPDPLGAIADDDLVLRVAPTALPGFDV